jgi:hypothetical protein
MLEKKRKEDLISYREFNALNSENNPQPFKDSPGSEADLEFTETLMGMEYDEDVNEKDETDEEDNILADNPAETDEKQKDHK